MMNLRYLLFTYNFYNDLAPVPAIQINTPKRHMGVLANAQYEF